MSINIRAAREDDAHAITKLVKSEPLNPCDRHWFNFFVAELNDTIVGAAQMRRHADGSRELGSLVVAPAHRGKRLAQRIIDAIMVDESGSVYMITGRAHAAHYARWGFEAIDAFRAPATVRRNFRMGAYGGRVMAVLQRRAFRDLVVLERPALPHRRREAFMAAQWF